MNENKKLWSIFKMSLGMVRLDSMRLAGFIKITSLCHTVRFLSIGYESSIEQSIFPKVPYTFSFLLGLKCDPSSANTETK